MSKYPVMYESSSKGPVDIESMATPHLLNAWRKLQPGDPGGADRPVIVAMETELEARGGVYDPETDQWTFPVGGEVAP